jgi:NAD(P)-dependent dehydrogenase (short-subunit alcohol dehydrogenase family)
VLVTGGKFSFLNIKPSPALTRLPGAKGIGRMISQGFIANGAKVYIASRDAKACEKAAAELNALGKGTKAEQSTSPPGSPLAHHLTHPP